MLYRITFLDVRPIEFDAETDSLAVERYEIYSTHANSELGPVPRGLYRVKADGGLVKIDPEPVTSAK